MPNSLKTKLSKLRHKCKITNEEYQELIAKLDGHDAKIRKDELRKFAIWLDTNGYMRKMDLNISRVEEALYEYEKEQKQ